MSCSLLSFRSSCSAWLWAVCGLVAISLTQGTNNHSGLARAAAIGCCYHLDWEKFAIDGSQYESTTHPTFPGAPVPIELVSLQLQSVSPPPPVSLPQPMTSVVVDSSVFDVFANLSIGGATQLIDSFFDITYRIDGVSGGPTTGKVNLEVLALTHGPLGSLPAMIRESPTLSSLGMHSITQLPDNTYLIDSFFDIFTELSLDGGQNWIPASGPIHMDLRSIGVPEPASLLLAGVIGVIGLTRWLTRSAKRPGNSGCP